MAEAEEDRVIRVLLDGLNEKSFDYEKFIGDSKRHKIDFDSKIIFDKDVEIAILERAFEEHAAYNSLVTKECAVEGSDGTIIHKINYWDMDEDGRPKELSKVLEAIEVLEEEEEPWLLKIAKTLEVLEEEAPWLSKIGENEEIFTKLSSTKGIIEIAKDMFKRAGLKWKVLVTEYFEKCGLETGKFTLCHDKYCGWCVKGEIPHDYLENHKEQCGLISIEPKLFGRVNGDKDYPSNINVSIEGGYAKISTKHPSDNSSYSADSRTIPKKSKEKCIDALMKIAEYIII